MNLQVLPSVCPLDCPDTCAVQITIEDGKMTKLGGNPDHPITRGFACVKMSKYPQRQNSDQRLLHPQLRVGPKGKGKFARCTWDEALEVIAEKTKENIQLHGSESVLPFSYAGTMGLVERDHPLAFFRALGASELDWTICSATAGDAWEINYGPNKFSTPPEDVAHSRLIILWGINALRSNSHLVPWMKEARKKGARILHIDPFRNETSRFADEHWQVNVGADAALALAIGNEIFNQNLQDDEYLQQHALGLTEYRDACSKWPAERAAELSGIPAKTIIQLARDIGEQPSTFIKVGYGMSRNEGGGNAIRAITLLPALTGAWKHQGGGGALSTSGAFPLNTTRFAGKHLLTPGRRHVNQNQLGRTLEATKNKISTLFVFNSNPAAVAPDSGSVLRGLSREDLFTVVLEHFQTDTADYADVLLPATTFLEHSDIYTAYGHYYLQWAEPVLEPRGECRPNSWVFKQLAERLGLNDPVFQMTSAELAQELLNSDHEFLSGIDLESLKKSRSIRLNMPAGFRPYANGSTHADNKIHFAPPPQQVEFKVEPNSEFPLRLISPPGPFILNTSMGNIPEIIKAAGGEPSVIVHPDDARQSNLGKATHIDISSHHGTIRRKVIISDDARKGVVIALGQWWPKLAPDRKSLNQLTSQELTDIGGGSLFGNPVVRISPASAV